MTDWVEGAPELDPNYGLPVGIVVEVRYPGNTNTFTYLVGHVNRLGGYCDDCYEFDIGKVEYVRWRRVWTPEE